MQKRPFNKNQVQVLRKMLAENPRDFALLNTGIDTSLRSIDLLHLKVQDIRTAWGEIREQIEVKQKKTGNRVCPAPRIWSTFSVSVGRSLVARSGSI